MDNQFSRVEDEYFRLKGQFATGRLTREQFETALQALMFTDAQGRYWMIGTDSGKWFVHDGTTWIEQNPAPAAAPAAPVRPGNLPERSAAPAAPVAYTPPQPVAQPVAPAPVYTYAPQPTPPPAPAPKSGGGFGRTLLFGCLGLIVLCGLLGVGGFLAYQSGALTTETLLSVAGIGPARASVNNFRDDTIRVKITRLDVEDDSFTVMGDRVLNAFDVRTFNLSDPSRYSAEFTLGSDGTSLGECVMRVRAGDRYDFVALPDGIMVNRANNPPTLGTDLVVATSTLCRAQ